MKELIEKFIELSEEYFKHADILKIGEWADINDISIYIGNREKHSLKVNDVEYDKNMETINIPYRNMELKLIEGITILTANLDKFITEQKEEKQRRLDKEIQQTQEKLNNLLKIKNNESVQSI